MGCDRYDAQRDENVVAGSFVNMISGLSDGQSELEFVQLKQFFSLSTEHRAPVIHLNSQILFPVSSLFRILAFYGAIQKKSVRAYPVFKKMVDPSFGADDPFPVQTVQ